MGEGTKAIGFQGAGQLPVQPSTPEVVQGNPVQPEFITREEALRMAREAAEETRKQLQGLIDKTNAGTLKKVQADLKALSQSIDLQKKAGIAITPEQEEKLKNQVIQQALTEGESPAPSGGQPAQAAPQDGEPVNPIVAYVNATCDGIEKTEGVALDEAEVKLLDPILDPYEYITAFRKAVTDKKARLASQPQTPNQPAARTPTNLGAQGTHNPNPIKHIIQPETLYDLAFKKGG